MDLVRSRVEQADSKLDTPPTTPIREEQTTTERGVTTADKTGPSLTADAAAATVPNNLPLTSPAVDRSDDQKIFSEPTPISVGAEEAAREAAILEVLRSPAALYLSGQQEESAAQGPEPRSSLEWRCGAALSLLTIGVLTLQQRHTRGDPAAQRRPRPNRDSEASRLRFAE